MSTGVFKRVTRKLNPLKSIRNWMNRFSRLPVRFEGLLLSILLLLPSLFWVFTDQQAFPGDHSLYAIDAVKLYYARSESLAAWLKEMGAVGNLRGPAISWFSQLFVGAGLAHGTLDNWLLFSGIIIDMIAINLLFTALRKMSNQQFSIAGFGVLMLAAAPKFIGSAHLFNVEPYQLLAVSWFIFILVSAPGWSRSLVLGQLLLASAYAMLAKSSTPLYIFIPALTVLVSIFMKRGMPREHENRRLTIIAVWATGVLITGSAGLWYAENSITVFDHALSSGFGHGASIWGIDTPYPTTLAFWLDEFQRLFFVPLVMMIISLSLFSGISAIRSRNQLTRMGKHKFIAAIVSAAQVLFVLLFLAFSPNRHTRFIIPLIPYVVFLACWSVDYLARHWIRYSLIALIGIQFIVANLYSLGFIPYSSIFSRLTDVIYAGPYNMEPTRKAVLEEIVTRTCGFASSTTQHTIIAVDPALKGDWLAPVPATYTAMKLYGKNPRCDFGYAGNSFWGADLETTWQDMTRLEVDYIVISDPANYPPPQNTYSESLSVENHPRLVKLLRESGDYVELPPLSEDRGILVFERAPTAQDGRKLLDLGDIEAGVALLEMLVDIRPKDREAWANLTLGYVLAGQEKDALAAGERALDLNPQHFYVHEMLADILFRQGDFESALRNIEAALDNPPNPEREAAGLALKATILHKSGATAEACRSLGKAITLDAEVVLPTGSDAWDCTD